MQPCFLFVGERFDAHPDFKLAKHLLMDIFRGEVVDELNLVGLDHVMACFAPDDKTLIIRQYCICMKKSGTRVRSRQSLASALVKSRLLL